MARLRASSDWAAWTAALSPDALRHQELFSRAPESPEAPAWWAVYVDEESPLPQAQRFGSFEELRRFLRDCDETTFVVPLFGVVGRFAVSEDGSGRKYLVHPAGGLAPLFDLQPRVRITNSFFLDEPDAEVISAPREDREVAADDTAGDDDAEEFVDFGFDEDDEG